ncbi:hypothetical protein ASPCAL11745 [Aspergillus calidoustus]|uniref:BZIP domain-containing protein n=1 Tax=Aspergillus calidoustus TaxID=454130 RepID=A0A0U4ZFW8_ASPCI|nr:hypothetical protein ASPCAL11745 [Aspergillus calidoustus]
MDGYAQSNVQTSPFPTSPCGEMHWSKTQFQNGPNYMDGYQDFDLPPLNTSVATPYQSIAMPVDALCNMVSSVGNYHQGFHPYCTFPGNAAITPAGSDSDSHLDSALNSTRSQNSKVQSVKRRQQNREAQRRFRERKDEAQQVLEQKAAKLEARIAELSSGMTQKAEEESRILREKDALAREVRDLRERWQLVERLLQRPSGAQTLSTLLSGSIASPEAISDTVVS